MTRPWLSVIIPTYNGGAYLPKALESIATQNFNDLECIAVDDGSTDSTLEILDKYKAKFPIHLIKKNTPKNWTTSTNLAIKLARGDYICFLHQDDIWYAKRLTQLKQVTEHFPEVVLILHPSYYINSMGKNLGLWRCPLPIYPKPISPALMIERLLIQNFISIPSPIFKREVALQVEGLDEKLWYTADWDFWLKIASCGNTIYLPKPLSGFRIHSSSQTIVHSSEVKDFRSQLEIIVDRYLPLWEAPEQLKHRVRKVADFSIDLNTALASTIHGKKNNVIPLILSFMRLGPSGWYRYVRDSRIWERVLARLRTQLITYRGGK